MCSHPKACNSMEVWQILGMWAGRSGIRCSFISVELAWKVGIAFMHVTLGRRCSDCILWDTCMHAYRHHEFCSMLRRRSCPESSDQRQEVPAATERP